MVMIGQAHCRQGACVGARTERRVLIDLYPLRRSRDLRCLVLGELGSVLGTQLTTVAVPYQVYQLTHSSLAVGLVSLAQLFPLIAGSLLGGSAVDAMDRRRLLMVAQVLMAGCSAGLAVNANLGTSLWPLFVLPALAAGFAALDDAGRSAIVPNLVQRSEVPTANAIFQALFQFGLVAGPAVAGLLLAVSTPGNGCLLGLADRTTPSSGRARYLLGIRGSRTPPTVLKANFEHSWRWRESNPRPSVHHQGFSGRSLLCFSQPRRSRKLGADRLSRCSMSRLVPRPGQAVILLADARHRVEGIPGLTSV